MSKSIVWVVVVIAVAGVAGGAYHYFAPTESTPAAAAPAAEPTPALLPAPPTKPVPDHGNFQKRFQPSMPGK